MTAKIPIARPFLGEEEESAVVSVLRSGWVSQGPRAAAFEEAVAGFVGVAHARAVNSGTGALHLLLLACGIGAGDSVIVPAFTCAAALHPLAAIGAHIVPVDIELDSYGIDPGRIEAAMTPRIRAVIVAHLFGHSAQIERISQLTTHYGALLIEDAALAIGVRIRGRHVGTFGNGAILSFHGRKTITTGEGGMVLTGSEEIAQRVAAMRNYGASTQAWSRHNSGIAALPRYDDIGFNYKLTDIQAAIGIEQMRKLPTILSERKRIAACYDQGLAGLSWLRLPAHRRAEVNGYQSYVCHIAPEETSDRAAELRDRLLLHLAEVGIASVQAAQSMARIAYYQNRYGWTDSDYPNATRADADTIALPIYPGLADDDQERVISTIRAFG